METEDAYTLGNVHADLGEILGLLGRSDEPSARGPRRWASSSARGISHPPLASAG
jgi:hypothetical protein